MENGGGGFNKGEINFMKKLLFLLAIVFLVMASVFWLCRAAFYNYRNAVSAEDYENSGYVKNVESNWDGAIVDYTKAIELRPDHFAAYESRGFAKESKGDTDGALADFSKAIELNPHDAYAYESRGDMKHDKGDLDGALADYTKAIELKPDDAFVYGSRGYVKGYKGDVDGALADYNKAIELKPDDAYVYNCRGWEKYEKGDVDGALTDYNQAIALDPENGPAYHDRGYLHYNSHQFADALADFRKSCELDSDIKDYCYFSVWLVRARIGEKEVATEELQSYWKNRKTGTPDDWPSKISSLLTGQLAEPAFFKAAENVDKEKSVEQHCEAYFYAGSNRLIEGDKTTAKDYFEKCLATGLKTFTEYQSAAAELQFLKNTQ
jgi:tetratricopeptide (TPR) repeat protein